MNIARSIIARVEDRLEETKNPCKSYASVAAAERAADKYAALAGEWYCKDKKPAQYIVVFVEKLGRHVVAFDQSEMHKRSSFLGGYVGLLANKGFFCY